MATLSTVCVYCGSSKGRKQVYAEAADQFGRHMVTAGIDLVYGGGSVGLMGIVAKSVLDAGGRVTGIIPKFLADREVMLKEAHELIVTEDMHERKRAMFDRADAFVALPGGIGTLEEVVEMLTWAQLGQHRKPVLLANIDGFWNPLLSLMDHMAEENFVARQFVDRIIVTERLDAIVPALMEAAASIAEADLRRQTDQAPLSNL